MMSSVLSVASPQGEVDHLIERLAILGIRQEGQAGFGLCRLLFGPVQRIGNAP